MIVEKVRNQVKRRKLPIGEIRKLAESPENVESVDEHNYVAKKVYYDKKLKRKMLLIIVYEERKESRRVYSAYKMDIIEN
ncbi:MAG TPA: hypothetical protein VNN20_16590 [Thermodesulfobacteriota bacterium]|nr:hypothetical protein [Thermodesulfobacteriota bacterium]